MATRRAALAFGALAGAGIAEVLAGAPVHLMWSLSEAASHTLSQVSHYALLGLSLAAAACAAVIAQASSDRLRRLSQISAVVLVSGVLLSVVMSEVGANQGDSAVAALLGWLPLFLNLTGFTLTLTVGWRGLQFGATRWKVSVLLAAFVGLSALAIVAMPLPTTSIVSWPLINTPRWLVFAATAWWMSRRAQHIRLASEEPREGDPVRLLLVAWASWLIFAPLAVAFSRQSLSFTLVYTGSNLALMLAFASGTLAAALWHFRRALPADLVNSSTTTLAMMAAVLMSVSPLAVMVWSMDLLAPVAELVILGAVLPFTATVFAFATAAKQLGDKQARTCAIWATALAVVATWLRILSSILGGRLAAVGAPLSTGVGVTAVVLAACAGLRVARSLEAGEANGHELDDARPRMNVILILAGASLLAAFTILALGR